MAPQHRRINEHTSSKEALGGRSGESTSNAGAAVARCLSLSNRIFISNAALVKYSEFDPVCATRTNMEIASPCVRHQTQSVCEQAESLTFAVPSHLVPVVCNSTVLGT